MEKTLVVAGTLAVGLRHFETGDLVVRGRYKAVPEPSNPKHKKAVAIYDGNNKVAYIDRDNADRLTSALIESGLIHSPNLVVPLSNSLVRDVRQGRSQELSIAFRVPSSQVEIIKKLFSTYGFVCHIR